MSTGQHVVVENSQDDVEQKEVDEKRADGVLEEAERKVGAKNVVDAQKEAVDVQVQDVQAEVEKGDVERDEVEKDVKNKAFVPNHDQIRKQESKPVVTVIFLVVEHEIDQVNVFLTFVARVVDISAAVLIVALVRNEDGDLNKREDDGFMEVVDNIFSKDENFVHIIVERGKKEQQNNQEVNSEGADISLIKAVVIIIDFILIIIIKHKKMLRLKRKISSVQVFSCVVMDDLCYFKD